MERKYADLDKKFVSKPGVCHCMVCINFLDYHTLSTRVDC